MSKILILFTILNIFLFSLFPEEITILDDSTRITREMVSPTESKEAMEAYNIGTNLLRERKFSEAEAYLLKAIELDTGYVDAMDHLGLVYRNLEKYGEAEKWYLKSIEINPNNLVPYINLGMVYRLQGRYEDSRQIYLRAQRIDPNDPEPYFGIGILFQLVEQYEVSINFMDIAMQKYNERNSVLLFNAIYAQGNNYYYIRKYEDALRFFKAASTYYTDNIIIQNRILEIENILK
jgi:tetratricopeptide (TPR) repeat protein